MISMTAPQLHNGSCHSMCCGLSTPRIVGRVSLLSKVVASVSVRPGRSLALRVANSLCFLISLCLYWIQYLIGLSLNDLFLFMHWFVITLIG